PGSTYWPRTWVQSDLACRNEQDISAHFPSHKDVAPHCANASEGGFGSRARMPARKPAGQKSLIKRRIGARRDFLPRSLAPVSDFVFKFRPLVSRARMGTDAGGRRG